MHLKIKIFFGMTMLSTFLLFCSAFLRVLIWEDSYSREQRLIHDYEANEGQQAKQAYHKNHEVYEPLLATRERSTDHRVWQIIHIM